MRVLLVDPVADLLPALQATLLAMQGVELYCAPDGTTAIQHAVLLGGVDVLITEVFLPGIDGFAVRDEIQAQTPSLLTVFLTRHDLRAYADAVRGTPVLPIPVNPDLVLSALQQPRPSRPSGPEKPKDGTTLPKAPSSSIPPLSKAPSSPPAAPSSQPSSADPALETPQIQKSRPPNPPSFPPTKTVEELYAEPAPQAALKGGSPAKRPYTALYPGATLGPYHLLAEDGQTPFYQKFAALHTSLGRKVHLVVMQPESAANSDQTASFLADARAKARIQHPSLLAVYEAGEIEGRVYYALERTDGESLENALLKGKPLEVPLLVKIAQTTAECLLHLRETKIPRPPLHLEDLLLQADGSVRLRNMALGGLHPATESGKDIALLGGCLLKLIPPEAPSELRLTLERTSPSHPKRIASWEELLSATNPVPKPSLHSPSVGPPPIKASGQPRTSRSFFPFALLLTGLALGAAVLFSDFFKRELATPEQALIPNGQYPVGTGRRVSLESFSIDSTEVTNRQYLKFIAWTRSHPREASRYDHPEQPPHHSHLPKGWEEMFPENFKPEKNKNEPLLELPVTQVSWWDAYAFAQWAGRILPTEEQWEAAGRGPRGFLFPWGDEPEPERTNVSRPEYVLKAGETNGPRGVLSMHDASVFGVKGLSGNVSEWTSTRRDGKIVVKGGHFNATLLTLDAVSSISPDTRSPNLGFRTASPPTQPSP